MTTGVASVRTRPGGVHVAAVVDADGQAQILAEPSESVAHGAVQHRRGRPGDPTVDRPADVWRRERVQPALQAVRIGLQPGHAPGDSGSAMQRIGEADAPRSFRGRAMKANS